MNDEPLTLFDGEDVDLGEYAPGGEPADAVPADLTDEEITAIQASRAEQESNATPPEVN